MGGNVRAHICHSSSTACFKLVSHDSSTSAICTRITPRNTPLSLLLAAEVGRPMRRWALPLALGIYCLGESHHPLLLLRLEPVSVLLLGHPVDRLPRGPPPRHEQVSRCRQGPPQMRAAGRLAMNKVRTRPHLHRLHLVHTRDGGLRPRRLTVAARHVPHPPVATAHVHPESDPPGARVARVARVPATSAVEGLSPSAPDRALRDDGQLGS